MLGAIPPFSMCSWHAEGQLDLFLSLKLWNNNESFNLEPSDMWLVVVFILFVFLLYFE